MAYTLDVGLNLGAANTGLTLEAQVVNTAGANVGAAITTGFVEFGATGNYLWHTAAMPDGHRGGIVFQVSPGGAIKTFVAINPEEVENTDVKTSTRLATGSYTAAPTAAAVADQVWDETLAGHLTAGSTGEALNDSADDLSAADVWAHEPRTLTTSIAAVSPPPVISGSVVSIIKADTMVLNFTGLGNITGRSKLWFAVKDDPDDADSESIIFIEETAGLQYLNGAAGTAGHGSIAVTSAALGNGTITLDEVSAALLSIKRGRFYSIKVLISGVDTTLTRGTADVIWSAVKAVA